MAFLDHIGKKISAAAGTAADKAKDLGEIAKLKAEILGVQSDINNAFSELGRKVYEQGKCNPESAYVQECARITGMYEQIESLRARIALVKSDGTQETDCVVNLDKADVQTAQGTPVAVSVCPSCGGPVTDGAVFCPKCGTKL